MVLDKIAASNVYRPIAVPTVDPTVRETSTSEPDGLTFRHLVDVAEVQLAVEQTGVESDSDGVKSNEPKFRPATVTETDPVRGTFPWQPESTAESKVSKPSRVPTTDPTVTVEIAFVVSNGDGAWQRVRVTDVHEIDLQADSKALAVTVKSVDPKFRPTMDTEAAPLEG